MADAKPRSALMRLESLHELLAERLENEAAILDVLVGGFSKGQPHPELWEMLHQAAVRDDRVAELAFAYERLPQDRRIKMLAPGAQADVMMYAARFFTDVFGDPDGAENFLERVLHLAPGHPEAFERFARILEKRGEALRLSDLYASAVAGRSERAEQLELLRKAAALLSANKAQDERAVRLYQQILKLDPADREARAALESRLVAAGRHSDVAKLLEQALLADPPPDGEEQLAIRSRLLDLYAGKLSEIERATPHVEEVLARDPTHERARRVAEQLLTHRAVAPRAAAALEAVFERLGDAPEAARMLALQVDHLRGPKRLEAQKRLAVLRFERLGDLAGARPMFEQIVAADPADDEMRQAYRTTAAAEGKLEQATRILTRAASGAKDPALKARIGAEVGAMYLDLGDEKRARAMFQQVLESAGDDDAVLRSARALARLAAESKEYRLLAGVLDRLRQLEPDASARTASAERLAKLCEEELNDTAGAVRAWRQLLGTKLESDAQNALERLFAASGAWKDLVELLEQRAETLTDPAAVRATALRAIELRVAKTSDRAATIEALERVRDRFGAARDLTVHLLPLYEQERRWQDLATTLASEVGLAPEAERAQLWVRLAQLRQSRLDDLDGALAAYRVALSLDGADRTSRLALEKLMAAGDHRLAAADILETVYRVEPSPAGVVRVLETRAELASDPSARLAALAEAAVLAARDLDDPARALSLTGRGLAEAVEHAREDLPVWLDRFTALAPPGGDASKRASLLLGALGEHAVDGPDLLELARHTAEALVQCGDVAQALEIYRRALAFDPSSTELLSRVDALLREQGSPEERLELYRAALEQPCEPGRRRELLHAIGGIQRRDLRDVAAAIATYRTALADDPDDRAAYAALLDAHAEVGAWPELYEELSRGLERARGDERVSLELRMADVSMTAGMPERAAEHYRRLLDQGANVPDDLLDRVLELSESLEDDELARLALTRRVATATDATEEAIWLERLGTVYAVRLDQPEPGIAAWMRGALLAEGAAADPDRATRLYERVLALAPSEPVGRDAAVRLVDIYRRAENWPRMVSALQSLLRNPSSDDEAIELVLALEAPATQAALSDVFIVEADRVLARLPRGKGPLWAAKARVLGASPLRRAEAAATYRQMVAEAEGDPTPAVAAFEAFLDDHGDDAELVEQRRWLWSFRADQATDADRVRVLLSWANAEEFRLGDPARAAAVYDRVLEVDPEQDEALAARSRLLLSLGDVEGAVRALAARRDRSEGEARSALELELAELLLDQLERPMEALDVVESVLESAPTDASALRIVERALSHEGARVRAAQLVERAMEAADDRELRGELLEVLLSTPASVVELRSARRRWYEQLLGHLEESPAAAFDVALRAVEELPEEEVLWDRAERIARVLSKPDRVAAAYRKLLEEQAPDRPIDDDGTEPVPLPEGVVRLPPEVVEVVGQRGVEYQEEWFDDPEVVAQMLRRILEVAPRATWAFERLKLAYNAAERWDDLFFLYDRVLRSVSDPDARVELLEDAALTAKDFAGDADRAIDYFAALLELRPDDARAASSLERLYERLGRHGPLIDLLSSSLASAAPEDAKALRLRIATLYMDGLGDAQPAFEAVERVLAQEPECEEAFQLLERLVVMPEPAPTEAPRADRSSYLPGSASSPPPRRASQPPPSRRPRKVSVRHRAATLLKERYKTQGRSADVVRMLEVELEGVSGAKERGRRLREIVSLKRDVLGDEAGAFDSLAQLLSLSPSSAEPHKELERLAESTGQWSAYADVLVNIADGVSDAALCRRLLAEAASIHRERLRDATMAIELGRRVLDLSGDDAADALNVARELDLLLSDAGRLAERCDVLERLAELEPDRAARRRAWGEVARIAMVALEDHDRAVRAERRRLDDDPADLEALDGLVRALREARRPVELIDALGQRALASPDPVARRRDHGEIAKLLSDELDRPDEAIDAWLRIRETYGPDDESADVLGTLLFERGRHEELCRTLAEEAARADTKERSAELWARLGDTHVGGTGMLDKAIGAYQTALDRDVENERARRGLEGLLATLSGEHERLQADVVGILTEAYATQPSSSGDGDWAATIALCPARLRVAESDAERAAVLVETARLLEERREDPQGAFDCSWQALVLTPDSREIADLVVRRAASAERWDHVASGISEVLRGEGDDVVVARTLWSQLAAWYRDVRQEPALAEDCFTKALAAAPGDVELLAGLAELQRRSKGRPLIETLLRLAEATGDDLDLTREAVEIAVEHVRDRTLAEPLAHRLIQVALAKWGTGGAALSVEGPEDSQTAARWAVDVLVRLSRDAGDEAGVKAAYLTGGRLPFDGATQREMLMAAAELATGDEAIDLLAELFDREPTDVRVAGRLEALYRAAGRRDDLLVVRRRQIEAADSAPSRAALRLHVAALHMEVEAWDHAIGVLRENLEELPTHESTVSRLTELLDAQERYGELADLWEAQSALRAESDPRGAAQLAERAAEIAEAKLGDVPRAIAAHERAVLLAESTRSMDALARLHTAAGDHDAAARVLERLVDRVTGDALAEQTARLCDSYLASGREGKARERLEALLPRVPNPAPLRARLCNLYRDAEAWGPLAELLAAEAADAPDRATRLARLREAADLHLNVLGDPASALPLLEQAADLDPENLSVRLLGCEALRLAGKSDEATSILRSIVTDYGGRRPKERALVHHELAKVALAAGDRARALGELDVAVKIDPGQPDVLYAIATLALEEGQLARAQRMFRALLLVLRSHRAATEERRNKPRISRAEVLLELADISERHGEPDRGAEFLESAFEVAAESTFEAQRMLAALRRRGRHDLLARALEQVLGAGSPDAAELLAELAGLYERHLGRKEDALEVRLRSLALAPTSREHHASTVALAREQGQLGRYVDAVEALISDASEKGEREVAVLLNLTLGDMLVEEGDDARAAEVFSRAEVEMDGQGDGRPDRYLRVWSALERIYERTGDAEAAASVLEKLAESTWALEDATAAEKAAPFYRLAFLKLAAPTGHDEACGLLERSVEMDPDAGHVLDSLRRAIEMVPGEGRILRLYEDCCRRQGDDRALVDALRRLAAVEGVESPAWREAVEVALRLPGDAPAMDEAAKPEGDDPAPTPVGDRALAEEILRQYLALARAEEREGPEAVWALRGLAELREREGDVAEAAELLERAGRVAAPGDERPLLLSAAALLAGPLGQLERAARIYEELHEREPAERDLWMPLAEVYRRLGDAGRLSKLIEETVPLVEELAERSNLRLERARIVLREDAEQASVLLFEILEEDSGHEEATRLLSEILEGAGRVDDLIALLNQQLDAAKDAGNKEKVVVVSMRLGTLLEERGQEDDALDIYHAASDWDADDPAVLRAVVRLSIQRGDSMDVGDALEKLLSVERGPEAVDVARQLYDVKSAHGDTAAAEHALELGYRAHPADEALREELVARHTERGEWAKLAEVQALEAMTRPDDVAKIDGLRGAAEVLRVQAGDSAAAAAMLERALAIDPAQREVLFSLIEALSEVGDFGRAHAALTRAIESLGERQDGWLYRSRASMQEALGRPDEALRDLQLAYAASGGDYAGELASLLEDSLRQAAGALDERRVREISLELAEVLGKAGDAERARYYLGELARRDAKDREVLHAMAALEEKQCNWDALSAAYRRLVSIEEGEALVEAALKLADACERGSRLADARGGLERALRANPQHGELRLRLRNVYAATGAYRELADLVLEDAEAAADVQGRFQHLVEAGRLLLVAEDETERAIMVLEEAAGLEPEEQSCTLRLAEAYAAAGRRSDAVQLLLGAIALHKGRRGSKLAEVYETMARLELREGNLTEALAALGRAFDSDPHNAAIALELGSFAMDLDDRETATRAFRAVTMMKGAATNGRDGASAEAKAIAYYHLGRLASAQGDVRRARLMLEKSVSEDPALEVARTLLEELRAG